MNFFRVVIWLSILMIVFNLAIGFVASLDVFPVESVPGTGYVEPDNILTTFTGLSGGMENLWLAITTVGLLLSIPLAILTNSLIPVGIDIFATVFWTAYIKSHTVLSVGGYIPTEFLGIFLGVMVIVFIAAIIAMLTGVD